MVIKLTKIQLKPLIACLVIFFSNLYAADLIAEVTVHIGPAASGNGGPNPISIPPTNILDYEVVWLTKGYKEWSFGLLPGILFGFRTVMKSGAYISLGGGLIINAHGVGPGIYSAFGYTNCSYLCFNMEYKQAIGAIPGMIIQPYALRVGLTFFTD